MALYTIYALTSAASQAPGWLPAQPVRPERHPIACAVTVAALAAVAAASFAGTFLM